VKSRVVRTPSGQLGVAITVFEVVPLDAEGNLVRGAITAHRTLADARAHAEWQFCQAANPGCAAVTVERVVRRFPAHRFCPAHERHLMAQYGAKSALEARFASDSQLCDGTPPATSKP